MSSVTRKGQFLVLQFGKNEDQHAEPRSAWVKEWTKGTSDPQMTEYLRGYLKDRGREGRFVIVQVISKELVAARRNDMDVYWDN